MDEALERARAARAQADAARPSEAELLARIEATHERAKDKGQVPRRRVTAEPLAI